MTVFERTVWIDAPLSDVWAFHSRIEGLTAVTPDWLDLRVESVRGPDTGAGSDELVPGTDIHLSVRPFGIGPRQRWTSRIIERDRSTESAYFTDEMIDGPFHRWVHSHYFYAETGGTRIVDRVDYAFPLGPFSRASIAVQPLLEVLFADRHRRTRRRLV